MTKIELGRIGAVVSPGVPGWVEAIVELERLGYPTVWLTGGPLTELDQVREAVRATSRVTVAPAILSVDRFDAASVNALYTELEADHPGRFLVGLGGAHQGRPLATLNAYLDELTAVPQDARILAALGPKMLGLARDRTAGAYPVLVTPDYVREARGVLGDDSALALMQLAVVDDDVERARAAARGPVGSLGSFPSYQQHFARMGFSDEEITPPSDRLTDALVFQGDAGAVAAKVRGQLDAGADHVALNAISPAPTVPLDAFRELAAELL
jgi:probable F420-dependent oxidoreductase